jgi:hypothetical protein
VADETTTTFADFLRESMGPLTDALRWKTVFLAELKRDKDPKRWNGKQITIPVVRAPQQGGQFIGETSTLNTTQVLDHEQANIKTAIVELAVSFSTQLIKQSQNVGDTSWVAVASRKMDDAEKAIARLVNEGMCGAGDALLAAVTSNSGSPSLTVPVGTAANFYQLYAGRIVDVKTRSNGADPGAGLLRKIASYDDAAGNVLFETTSYGGGSGTITFSANEGIYVQGSYSNPMQGFMQATATSGTFQGLNKASVFEWQGTDASPAAATDPSLAVFDRAERKAYQKSGTTPDFYLCDPAVVDKYQQSFASAARWQGAEAQLATGFTGVEYRKKVLLPEFDMAPKTAGGVFKEDIQIYTLDDGPSWDDLTGAIYQRFNRQLPVEAWMVWMLQLGFYRCNSQVKVGNLNQAS